MSEPERPADAGEPEAIRATARLPGLDIEIVHHRAPADGAEHIAIHLRAQPSFADFGGWAAAANPFAFWMQATQIMWGPMWAPWLAVAGAMMGQAGLPPPLRRVPGHSHPIAPAQEPE